MKVSSLINNKNNAARGYLVRKKSVAWNASPLQPRGRGLSSFLWAMLRLCPIMPLEYFWCLPRRHKEPSLTWWTCWDWQNYYSGRWFPPWRAIIWFLFRRRWRRNGPLRIWCRFLFLTHLYIFAYLRNLTMHASSSDVQLRWLESIWWWEAS